MTEEAYMKNYLGILRRIDPARDYQTVSAGGSSVPLFRLIDAERNYSPNLSAHEMAMFIHGFALGIEIAMGRYAEQQEESK